MKPVTHIVYFRDQKGGDLKIYGPFVSERLAAEFCDELPEPVSGAKNVHTVAPFTHHEVDLAKDEILKKRHH